MSTVVTTPNFRVAFPNVFQAKKNTLSGKDEFGLVALFPKGADLAALKTAAQAALVKKFGEDKTQWPKNLKTPFRDQGDRAKIDPETGKETLPQGYEKGAIYINLKSGERPGVVDQSVQPILDSSLFYGGCWARAHINAYAYDQAGNRGVAFGLQHVQKVKDGDPFGNRVKVEDAFAPVATEAGSDSAASTSTDDLFS